MTKPLALTSGEPAGIGPDITLLAWLRRTELKLPAFYLRGDAGLLRERARALGLDVRLVETSPEDAVAAFADALRADTLEKEDCVRKLCGLTGGIGSSRAHQLEQRLLTLIVVLLPGLMILCDEQ